MRLNKMMVIYLLGLCTILYTILASNSSGITGKSVTGCAGAGCHAANPNTTISLNTNIPIEGYTAGNTYTFSLTVINFSKSKSGFDLSVDIGSLTPGPGMALNGLTELYHTIPKNMSDGVTVWDFTWTAPASGNSVTVNVAANAVDGLGTQANDECNTKIFKYYSTSAVRAPTIINVSQSAITQTSAVIGADIYAHNANTNVSVEYGLTAVYGSSAGTTPASVTGNTATPVSATLSGLTPGKLYHYHIKASNASGTTYSPDLIFVTDAPNAVNDTQESGIEVYPNPVTDYLFYSNKNNRSDVKLSVIGMNNALQNVIVEKVANGNYKIQTNTLAPGNYVLLIELSGKKYYHHFLK